MKKIKIMGTNKIKNVKTNEIIIIDDLEQDNIIKDVEKFLDSLHKSVIQIDTISWDKPKDINWDEVANKCLDRLENAKKEKPKSQPDYLIMGKETEKNFMLSFKNINHNVPPLERKYKRKHKNWDDPLRKFNNKRKKGKK